MGNARGVFFTGATFRTVCASEVCGTMDSIPCNAKMMTEPSQEFAAGAKAFTPGWRCRRRAASPGLSGHRKGHRPHRPSTQRGPRKRGGQSAPELPPKPHLQTAQAQKDKMSTVTLPPPSSQSRHQPALGGASSPRGTTDRQHDAVSSHRVRRGGLTGHVGKYSPRPSHRRHRTQRNI